MSPCPPDAKFSTRTGTLGVLARNGSSHTHVLVGDMLGFYTPDGGVVGYDEWDL